DEDFRKMGRRACAAGGDDGNLHSFRDAAGEFAVEAVAHAVFVHTGEQDFAGATLLGFTSPLDDAAACRDAASGDEDFGVAYGVLRARRAASIDGNDDSLRS